MVVFGTHDERTIAQLRMVANDSRVVAAALMGDAHAGYSMPIGGVAAYRNAVSPSGVGFDISCGLKAVRTNLTAAEIANDREHIADQMARDISFGVGRANARPVDHALFHDPLWITPELAPLRAKAMAQLGTVGAGNHFVDILADDDGYVWIMAHFGSRGFGHAVASGFLNLAAGRQFHDRMPGESMDHPPTVLGLDTDLGQFYLAAHNLAGQYAYAGRDAVVADVLRILGADVCDSVHVHHNYAFDEVHGGERLMVVRKGATPLAPGDRGALGGSMGTLSAIVRGVDSLLAQQSLYSAPHGAGRIMSRTAAAGKVKWLAGSDGKKRPTRVAPGLVSHDMMNAAITAANVVVRGGGLDEAPMVYRNLPDVLADHAETLVVETWLRPLIVVMAPADTLDPYKD